MSSAVRVSTRSTLESSSPGTIALSDVRSDVAIFCSRSRSSSAVVPRESASSSRVGWRPWTPEKLRRALGDATGLPAAVRVVGRTPKPRVDFYA